MSDIRGLTATVRWGYRPVATLGPWSFSGDNTAGMLTAQVVTCEAFGITQRPLTVVIQTARATWYWPVLDCTLSGASLSAAIGPRQ